jgi:1-acyl-sn-glycerol-3-phosphate acyltransferase
MTARADGPGRTRPRAPASRRGLSADSPLLGGPFAVEAGAEVVPAAEPGREVDDWGRSQRVLDLIEPLLDFYYRYWFRVEAEGIEHVPSQGGALIVSNRSGALPPDAPMIMQAIRHEHRHPRPLYMLGEHWSKGYPGVGMLANKIGLVAAHPANAQRLLRDEQRLALGRFGHGGFVRTAMRGGVPIVPVAVIGAEEAMPIFGQLPLLPAKFRIRFLEPVDLSGYPPEDAEDVGLVQQLAEEIRARIQAELDELLLARRSVWFG